jgi:hypothetical protein
MKSQFDSIIFYFQYITGNLKKSCPMDNVSKANNDHDNKDDDDDDDNFQASI